jgi:hypothetical protein
MIFEGDMTRWITKNGKRIPLSGGGKGAGTVLRPACLR